MKVSSIILLWATLGSFGHAGVPADFQPDPAAGELSRTIHPTDGVRAVIHLPPHFDPTRPTLLVLFALPNGNTIEQTIGCKPRPGLDWHFNIQNIGAQVAFLRRLESDRNVVVAYLEADGLSWPAWRGKRPDAPRQIAGIVTAVAAAVPCETKSIALACHSGGGAFLFSFIDSADAIPPAVERFVFLDANYSYDDAKEHGTKLLAWLKADARRRLVVVAYDDREITLNGKKVVSPTGGTWRATERMLARFRKDTAIADHLPPTPQADPVATHRGVDDRLRVILHTNPENRILHTRLVERNGFIEAMTVGTKAERKWGGSFLDDPAYGELQQTTPSVPARPPTAPGGKALAEKWANLSLDDRETSAVAEIGRGNFPESFRAWKRVTTAADIEGKQVVCAFDVMPDYLAAGGDGDFLRLPLTPAAARRIADTLGCELPTRKLVDAIDSAAMKDAAAIRVEPRPLAHDREAFATFVDHHRIIEEQRAAKPKAEAGKAGLLVGAKKDVVISNRLLERDRRLALYGWRKPDDAVIQPLTIVHHDRYLDYSHGVRLIRAVVTVDGKPMELTDVLRHPKLHVLVSDEGPIDNPAAMYRKE